MPRFTISHHTDSPEGEHFDLFLEVETALATWRLSKTSFEAPQAATKTDDHRVKYLDYEGAISNNRGRVKIWDTGTYSPDVWTDNRIVIVVRGKQIKTRLQLERGTSESAVKKGEWKIFDPTVPVRRMATTLLRSPDLDRAPTPELENINHELSVEEQQLMVAVQAFAKGDAIAWDKVATSPGVRERLRSERAKWRHPWLEAAFARAERLDELAQALRAAKG